MADTPLYYLSIAEASARIQSGELSPVELTQAFLDRIDALDGELNSYILVTRDEALAAAHAAEDEIAAGRYRGPLHGIPIALKDLYDTKGIATTGQSKLLESRIPEEDCTVWVRLREAGAVLLGKLTMFEFALGGPDTSLAKLSRNPWDLGKSPGGSSSGSGTAMAAGLAMGTLGSDTGGSIRIPAAYCGIVGIKPTYGRVSRAGVLPLSWSLDHAGPMTWTVEDAALMLQPMAGHDPADPTSSTAAVPDYRSALRDDLSGLTVGFPRSYIASPDVMLDDEVHEAFHDSLSALRDLGATVEVVEIPSLEHATQANSLIMIAEAHAYHVDNLRNHPDLYGQTAKLCFTLGGMFSSGDYVQSMRLRAQVRSEYAALMERVDLIATPTMATPASDFDFDLLPVLMISNFMGPMNMTGMPALSIPNGFSKGGLPIGLQLAGRPFGESTVLGAGHAYEKAARPFARPPV